MMVSDHMFNMMIDHVIPLNECSFPTVANIDEWYVKFGFCTAVGHFMTSFQFQSSSAQTRLYQ
jgi:hypothetical protein